jgi:hypothetical protein
MKEKVQPRQLSNGGLFVFNPQSKELYLISKENVQNWHNSTQDLDTLKEFVKAGKASHFDKNALLQISDALNKVALLG